MATSIPAAVQRWGHDVSFQFFTFRWVVRASGGAAKAHFLRAYHEAFPDLTVRIEELVATDDDVAVRYVATG